MVSVDSVGWTVYSHAISFNQSNIPPTDHVKYIPRGNAHERIWLLNHSLHLANTNTHQ